MKDDSKSAEGSQTKRLAEYSVAEPSVRRFPYAAWVPTANGRLSFRHIGESSHPAESLSANISAPDKPRYILSAQVRPLSDVLFPKFVHPLLGLTGNIPFVLSARSYKAPDHDHIILGSVHIFSSRDVWRRREANEASSMAELVLSSIDQMNEHKQQYSQIDNEAVKQCWKRARIGLTARDEVTLCFKLLRTGEIYFSEPVFRDRVFEANTVGYARKNGYDFYAWLANQAFFFLKDICHKHQHHDAHSDTILNLQKRSTSDPYGWRRNIIYSLHYHIIRAKRSGDGPSLAQSLGILAYCSSFESISERGDWIKPSYNIEALRESIEARLRQIELADAARDRAAERNNSRVGITLAIWGILAALLIMLVQPSIEDKTAPPAIEKIATILSLLFLPILGFSAIFTLLVLVVLWDNPKAGRYGPRRDSLEMFNANLKLFKWIFFGLGLLIMASSIYLERNFLEKLVEGLYKLASFTD